MIKNITKWAVIRKSNEDPSLLECKSLKEEIKTLKNEGYKVFFE